MTLTAPNPGGRFGIIRDEPLDPLYQATVPVGTPPASYFFLGDVAEVKEINWGMDGNDDWSNCFWAGIAHALMMQAATGLDARGNLTYQPGFTPPSEQEVINWFRGYLASQGQPTTAPGGGTGLSSGAHYALGHGLVEAIGVISVPLSPALVHQIVTSFKGGVVLCLALDPDAQREFQEGLPWGSESFQPDYQDGHAVASCGFDPQGDLVVTWGKTQATTIPFDTHCIDGMVVIIGKDSPFTPAEKEELISTWGLQTAASATEVSQGWYPSVVEAGLRAFEAFKDEIVDDVLGVWKHLHSYLPVQDIPEVPDLVEGPPVVDLAKETDRLQRLERRLREILGAVLSRSTEEVLSKMLEKLLEDFAHDEL